MQENQKTMENKGNVDPVVISVLGTIPDDWQGDWKTYKSEGKYKLSRLMKMEQI